jgi:peptidoglycan/LPS O-acetylase OafA/YrhL
VEASDKRFAGFDGLRAIAILLVILWHTALSLGFPLDRLRLLTPVVVTGWAGVDLFFALSGFLITTLLLREEGQRTGEGFSLRYFWARRALRILPIFLVVVAINTFVLARHPVFQSVRAADVFEKDSPLGLWPYVTLWGNYFTLYAGWFVDRLPVDPGKAYEVLWSLCVEEHFYLLWPLVLLLVRRGGARLAVAGLVCLGLPFLRLAALQLGGDPPTRIHGISHFRIDSILWGALAALVFAKARVSAPVLRAGLVAALVTVACLVRSGDLWIAPPASAWGVSAGFSMLALASSLLLLELAQHPGTGMARVLDVAPLAWVGRLSYAMYLVHFQAIDLARALFAAMPLPPPPKVTVRMSLLIAWGVVTALTVLVAAPLHYLVERPALAFKRRFSLRRDPQPDAASKVFA